MLMNTAAAEEIERPRIAMPLAAGRGRIIAPEFNPPLLSDAAYRIDLRQHSHHNYPLCDPEPASSALSETSMLQLKDSIAR